MLRRIFSGAIVAYLCAGLGSVAWAAQHLTLQAKFTPDELGVPTNLAVRGKFESTVEAIPSPITRLVAYAPAGMTIDLRGSGTCAVKSLEAEGPKGCPSNARAGFGGGVGLLQLAHEIIPEPYTVDIFRGPDEGGRHVFLAYVLGLSPALVELVLKAREISAPKPYGIGFSIEVPPIPTLPGASNASVQSAFLTFGSTNLAYYKAVHGVRKLIHVRGVVTPRTCPRGGFPLEAKVEFADGTATTVRTAIPCPGR